MLEYNGLNREFGEFQLPFVPCSAVDKNVNSNVISLNTNKGVFFLRRNKIFFPQKVWLWCQLTSTIYHYAAQRHCSYLPIFLSSWLCIYILYYYYMALSLHYLIPFRNSFVLRWHNVCCRNKRLPSHLIAVPLQ